MKRLSGLDASFLYLETPSSHMHVSGIGVFDPSTAEEWPSFERIIELTEERLHLAPSFRQRLVGIPFELHHPLWVDDPAFDIEYHMRRAALPAPGGPRELADFAADVTSRPLDRSRPLWEIYIVEGLEGGHVASISKTHHAAIDGVSGVDLTVALMDLEPNPPPVTPPEEPWAPERVPSDVERVAYAIGSLARQPFGMARLGRRTLRGLRDARRPPEERGWAPPPAPFSAPRTSLNRAITPRRSFAYTDVPLDDLKAVKNALGGTVNDVVLAMCSGALRRWFDARGEELERSLVAMVPISVRSEREQGALGNRVSSMLVSLASLIDDPAERLAAISASTRGAKEQHNALGPDILSQWVEYAAPGLAARAARLYSRTRLADRHRPIYNLTISNVPGPPIPLYSYGARMVASYPMGPINEGAGLNITVTSYLGQMYFGLHACRETVPDPWPLAAALEDALAELLAAAGARSATAQPAGDGAVKARPRPRSSRKPRAKKTTKAATRVS
jgi:WS/DGAT/MGAT family acyltransferase